MTAFYSENDRHAAAWLRELIAGGHIAPGVVDERDIRDVKPEDLDGYTQCHFFGGIGGWSLALRIAGWGDDRPVWTASVPCQPYSIGGEKKAFTDPRDLWPVFARLVRERRPVPIFGEQVKGAIAHGWLDRLCDDLEAEDYAVGAHVFPASAVGAKHERQRIYWVADAGGAGWEGHQPIGGVSRTTKTSFTVDGNPLVGSGRALAGDYSDLLPCDGLSLQLERDALTGYGNAICPQAAAVFIEAFDASRSAVLP